MRCTYFCGMQTVYELQKILALYVKTKQDRYNRPTVITSAMDVQLAQRVLELN